MEVNDNKVIQENVIDEVSSEEVDENLDKEVAEISDSNGNKDLIAELKEVVLEHYNKLIDLMKFVENGGSTEEDSKEDVEENNSEKENEEEPVVSDEKLNLVLELKDVIAAHFNNLRSLIKFVKSKDANISQLTNEIQKYREGYCNKIFKSIAISLISYREDCRKAYEEMGQYNLDVEKIKKYIQYLTDDFEQVLSEIGLEEDGDEWKYNGKSLSVYQNNNGKCPEIVLEKMDIESEDDSQYEEEMADEEITADSLKEYLKKYEEKVQVLLKKNEELDNCLNFYIKNSKKVEEGIVFAYIYPSLRKLLTLNEQLKELTKESISLVEEKNKYEKYNECLLFIINKLEEVLLNGGVSIYTPIDDVFDVKRNRLSRTIETNELEKDRMIVKKYTECYILNENVIYPSRVDVYKYKEKEPEIE